MWYDCLLDLGTDFPIGNMSLYEMCSIVSIACILLWSSVVRVHDSQAYRKMDVTKEHIKHTLELREILLSLQTGFNLVNVAVVCAVLESISEIHT